MVCDINDFKRINDVHGHHVGDVALRWVGGFLAALVRTEDVVCRVGGDEFAVLLPGADELGCRRLVRRLRERLRSHAATTAHALSLSVGTATFSDATSDAVSLVAAADAAMYRDKSRLRTGRARRPSMA